MLSYQTVGVVDHLPAGQEGLDMTDEQLLSEVSCLGKDDIKEILALSDELKNTELKDFKLAASDEIKA